MTSSPSPRKVSQVQQLTESEFEERFEHAWAEVDANGDGSIDEAEVGAGLGAAANVRLASYQVRDLLLRLKSQGKVDGGGRVSKAAFKEVKGIMLLYIETP